VTGEAARRPVIAIPLPLNALGVLLRTLIKTDSPGSKAKFEADYVCIFRRSSCRIPEGLPSVLAELVPGFIQSLQVNSVIVALVIR
jgi:hypothetical protein